MDLPKMLDQTYIHTQILKQATQRKIGIFQSMRRAKMRAKGANVQIQKLWDLTEIDAPTKKVDRKRTTQKEKTYKETKIINK